MSEPAGSAPRPHRPPPAAVATVVVAAAAAGSDYDAGPSQYHKCYYIQAGTAWRLPQSIC